MSSYSNAADIMRPRPGLNSNLTVVQYTFVCSKLFKFDPGSGFRRALFPYS